MDKADRHLACVDCQKSFLFSAADQQYHLDKGYQDPKRCTDCRKQRRVSAGAGAKRGRMDVPVVCASCGKETTVPFKPIQGRPVLCRDCFSRQKGGPDLS